MAALLSGCGSASAPGAKGADAAAGGTDAAVDSANSDAAAPDSTATGSDASGGTDSTDAGSGTDNPDAAGGTDNPDAAGGTDSTDAGSGTDNPDAAGGTDSTDAGSGTDSTDAGSGTDSPDAGSGTDQADAASSDDTTSDTAIEPGTDALAGSDAAAVQTAQLTVQVKGTDGQIPAGLMVWVNGVDLSAQVSAAALEVSLEATEWLIQVAAPGYAPAARKVLASADQSYNAAFALAPVQASAAFLATEATAVSVGGAQLTLPANAFVDALGMAFDGTVTVLAAPVGLSPAELAGAPGPLQGTPDGQSDPVQLAALFLADVQFVDQNGAPLQLAAGQQVTLVYTLPPALAALYPVGSPLTIWSFDLTSASWQPEGSGVVEADPASGASVVTLTAGHFSWWLIATGQKAAGCVQIVVTEAGAPLAGANVQVIGMYGQGYQLGTTNAAGTTCVQAPADTDVLVQVADFFSVQKGGGQVIHVKADAASCGGAGVCTPVVVELMGAAACTTAVDCDDSNACTKEDCSGGTCLHYQISGGPCEDGNTCVTSKKCLAGACAGPLVVCDDSNVCTNDSCVSGTGCVHTHNSAPCQDGDACTLADTCSAGSCTAGAPNACDDQNGCTIDSCAAPDGCVHLPAEATCDDGAACTADDVCTEGACVGVPSNALCDDANACTEDVCAGLVGGCTFSAKDGSCEDGDPCSGGDDCQDGSCIGLVQKPAPYLDAQLQADTTFDWFPNQGDVQWQKIFFDQTLANPKLMQVTMRLALCGNLAYTDASFTLELYHETKGTVATATPVPFASLPTSCGAVGLQDGPAGAAVFKFGTNGVSYEKGGAYYWLILRHTVVSCEGTCSGYLQSSALYNPNSQTQGSVFTAYQGQLPPQYTGLRLVFLPVVVDDTSVVTNGFACDDGLACTTSDACKDGQCAGAVVCDDDVDCTFDACSADGCSHTPSDALCEDNDPCSTVDVCSATQDCQHLEALADGTECTDGNLCTVSGSCKEGVCKVVDKDCEDGDFCTVNYCDRLYGSGNCAVDSVDCNDNNPCTSDFCTNGACAPEPINQPIGCDDGVDCTGYSNCQPGGVCKPVAGFGNCAVGDPCLFNETCKSEKCENGVCAFSTCHDEILSGDESDVDCGGSCNRKCFAGQKCNQQSDCDQTAYNKYCSVSQGICWFTAE